MGVLSDHVLVGLKKTKNMYQDSLYLCRVRNRALLNTSLGRDKSDSASWDMQILFLYVASCCV
jgi:hypothetical protein